MKHLIVLLLLTCTLFNCSEKRLNEKEISNQVISTYKEMYTSYGKGTDEFFKYFENDFLRITPTGKMQVGVAERKAEWNEYLKTHSLILESFDEPELIISSNQVITIGEYVEYLIDNQTKDSLYNRGIYIATWKRQDDDNWKICMDTWHPGLKKE